MSSYKIVTRETTVVAAINDAFDELENLASEMSDWRDNMEEKFSHTEKYDRVSEAADALENVSRPDDIPESVQEIAIQYCESVPKAKTRQASRAVRASNCAAMLNAAAEAIREKVETLREEANSTEAMDEEAQTLDYIADEIENVASEVEGIDFPGAFGG